MDTKRSIHPWSLEDRLFLENVGEPAISDLLALVVRGLEKEDIRQFHDDLRDYFLRKKPIDTQYYINKLLLLPVEETH